MSPLDRERAMVEGAVRRLTDGSLSFRTDADKSSVVAAVTMDRRTVTATWSRLELREDPSGAERGVREMLRELDEGLRVPYSRTGVHQ